MEEPPREPPSSATPQPPNLPDTQEPATEPQATAPTKPASSAPCERLPEAGPDPQLHPNSRVFWRAFGKGKKEAGHQHRGSKYVQTQPLYQNYWIKRQKAPEHKPPAQALRAEAGLSAAALLSSSLLLRTASHHHPPRDYSFSFWQEMPEVKSRGLLHGLASQQRRLQEAMFEVITSEASYLRSLLVAVSHFQLSPGLRGVLTGAELRQLFSNLPQVKDVSERFLLQLEEHLDQDVFLPGLGEVVLRHCPAFRRVYVPYVTNQIQQERLMQQLMKGPGRFLRVLCKLEEQPVCQRQPLKSFLVLPFQRITRLKILLQVGRTLLRQICKAAWLITAVYFPFGFKVKKPLSWAQLLPSARIQPCRVWATAQKGFAAAFFWHSCASLPPCPPWQNILKWTGPDSELAKSVGLAHKAVGEIVSQCNENLQLMKQEEELVMLEKLMDFSKVKSLPLFSQGRWLVQEGEFLQVLVQEAGLGYRPHLSLKAIHLHLFNDLLLLSHRKEDGRFLVKDYAWTCHIKAELFRAKSLGLPEWSFYLCISQNCRDESRELILKAGSEAQRQDWISRLASN
ncbi:rho guanine nucleotide exchange factor 19 [Liasis olivaceus]